MKKTPNDLAIVILDSIIEMSDQAEANGGATSIAGIASLHKLQSSIQRNKLRIVEALREQVKNENTVGVLKHLRQSHDTD